MLEAEIAGRSLLLERALGFRYDLYLTDSSGAGVGEPVARVGRAGTGILGTHSVIEGERTVLVLDVPIRAVWGRRPYDVFDGAGQLIGRIERESRSYRRWAIRNANDAVSATVERRSLPLSFLRLLLNHFFLAALFLPYRFALVADGREIGSFRRLPRARRRYALELAADSARRFDPRLALGLAVALAELEEVH